jgi:hypothetical protein
MLLLALARRQLEYRFQESYIKGFAYHQGEARNDKKLFDWIMLHDYMGRSGELDQ